MQSLASAMNMSLSKPLWFWALVWPPLWMSVTAAPEVCERGEGVEAYFAGEVDFGDGIAEPCNPSIDDCWFEAQVQERIFSKT